MNEDNKNLLHKLYFHSDAGSGAIDHQVEITGNWNIRKANCGEFYELLCEGKTLFDILFVRQELCV